MRLSFYGAAHEVTGSCHFLEVGDKKILIDCGMEQGRDADTVNELPVAANQIDFVFLTHAHIDHSGRLPFLEKEGFCGAIYATDATYNLCEIMLRDSAHIQEFEAEWKNRKGKRSGKQLIVPDYTIEDAENVLKRFVPCNYGDMIDVTDDIKIRFTDVGHLLGSSCIEVWASEGDDDEKIVFSGDVGNINQPLIKDPSYITEADYVVIESTYGDRNHDAPPDYAVELASVIQRTLDRGGNVVIPSFAVGRTQEILYFIRHIKEQNMVKNHPDFPVYVDSPLAIEATNIFNENQYECFDDEAMDLVSRGINPISFKNLKCTVSSEESKMINFNPEPKVIISSSGMCEAGRIKHHLKHNLWRKECTVVFVGYQGVGTAGRLILDGAEKIKMLGEEIMINAEIVKLEGISGHADQKGLLKWLDAFSQPPKRIFVVHGEETVCETFGGVLRSKYDTEVSVPFYSESYDLTANEMLKAGVKQVAKPKIYGGAEDGSPVYRRLVAAGNRLLAVIKLNKGGTNKDLGRFADQIEALSSKWER